MDERKIQQELDELKRRVGIVESAQRNPIDRYTSEEPRKIIGEESSRRALDSAWNEYFYFFSPFEAADGWDVVGEVADDVDSGGLHLQTTAIADNRSNAVKSLPFVADFDHNSRFRTVLYLDVDTAAADLDYSLSIGSGIPVPHSAHYGFRVEDNVLYGTCSNGDFESKVQLLTLEGSQGNGLEAFIYIVEARLFAGSNVEFYVSNVNETKPILRNSLSKYLPSGSGVSISYDLYTRTTTAKKAHVYFVEYIQDREQT